MLKKLRKFVLFPAIYLVFLYLHFSLIYKESPKAVPLIKSSYFATFRGRVRLLDGLWNVNYASTAAEFSALSGNLFGFSLTAFPISLYYDLLTKLS